ncbi:MAG TPA: Mut7-C RNAse domain-containing protein [Candidatus Thermoplasmatota archaeon]
MAGARPRFAADAMLGSLARWLRLLGYDTTYERDAPDERVVQLAQAQGRVVLTRDRAVARRAGASLFVASHDLEGQMAEVFAWLGLEVPAKIALERCSVCNARLVPADAAAARQAGVPDRVLGSKDTFWRCPGCRRVYWEGTHVASMGLRLSRVRAREPGNPPGGPTTVK